MFLAIDFVPDLAIYKLSYEKCSRFFLFSPYINKLLYEKYSRYRLFSSSGSDIVSNSGNVFTIKFPTFRCKFFLGHQYNIIMLGVEQIF